MGDLLKAFAPLTVGALVELMYTDGLAGTCPSWREGDVCIVEAKRHHADHWLVRNLRTGDALGWPSTARFRLLEDKADD